MRPSKDETWLNVARELSRQSTCLRRAVGCVLIDERGHFDGTGWNGVAAGQSHCNERRTEFAGHLERVAGLTPRGVLTRDVYPHACEGAQLPSGQGLEKCEALHAEQNALLQCSDPWQLETCYCTHSPCVTCVKLLMNTTCRHVVFLEEYAHNASAREMWIGSYAYVRGRPEARTWELYKRTDR